MQHKMQTAWRASFQHLSTNTLAKLDEHNESDGAAAAAAGKTPKRTSLSGLTSWNRNDSFVVPEGEEGTNAMTF